MAQDQTPQLYVNALLLPFENLHLVKLGAWGLLPTLPNWFNHFKGLRAKTSSYKGSPYCDPQRAWMEIEIYLVDAQVLCHIGFGGGGVLGWPVFQTQFWNF